MWGMKAKNTGSCDNRTSVSMKVFYIECDNSNFNEGILHRVWQSHSSFNESILHRVRQSHYSFNESILHKVRQSYSSFNESILHTAINSQIRENASCNVCHKLFGRKPLKCYDCLLWLFLSTIATKSLDSLIFLHFQFQKFELWKKQPGPHLHRISKWHKIYQTLVIAWKNTWPESFGWIYMEYIWNLACFNLVRRSVTAVTNERFQ